MQALRTAATGMAAQQLNVEVISNNIANMNTVGFKRQSAVFEDLLYQNVMQPGASASAQTVLPAGLQLGMGTRPSSNEIVFTQGSFSETDNPLDVVIQGSGFFQVLQPSGQMAYTRDGEFQLDRSGNIVTASGNPVQPTLSSSARPASQG